MEEEKEYYVVYEENITSDTIAAIFTEEDYANKWKNILIKEYPKTTFITKKIKDNELSHSDKFITIDRYKSNIEEGLNVYKILISEHDIEKATKMTSLSVNDFEGLKIRNNEFILLKSKNKADVIYFFK